MQYFRANQAVALLSLTVFLWTLTIAPAMASLRLPQPTVAPEVTASVVETAPPPATKNTDKDDHATCACLLCSGKKTCCCKPPAEEASNTPGRASSNCQLQSLCDRATKAVNLPFSWWVAVIPSPSLTTLPPVVALSSFSFHAGTPLETAFSEAPEAPPRFLS